MQARSIAPQAPWANLGLALLGLGLACGLSACGPGPEGPPRESGGSAASAAGSLRIPKDDHDFGKVWEGRVLEHTYSLEVASPLALSSIERSCGCTRADLWRVVDGARTVYVFGDRLSAGSALELDVAFETLGRPGTQQKTLDLLGDWPGGRARVSLSAVVVSYLESEPAEVALADTVVGGTVAAQVELRAVDGRAFDARLAREGLPEGVQLSLVPRTPDDFGRAQIWDLGIELGSDLDAGSYRWPVRIATDLTEDGRAEGGPGTQPDCLQGVVRFEHHRRQRVEARPRHLDLGMLGSGQLTSRLVQLDVLAEDVDLEGARMSHTLALTDGTDLSEHFQTRFDPAAAGGPQLEISCSGLPDGVRGAFRGMLTLELGADPEGGPADRLIVGVGGAASGR